MSITKGTVEQANILRSFFGSIKRVPWITKIRKGLVAQAEEAELAGAEPRKGESPTMTKNPNQSIIDQLDEAGRIIYEGRICPKAGEKIKTQAAVRKEIRAQFPFGHEMTAQAISKRESILRKLDSGPIPDREMKEAGFVLCNNIKVRVSKDLTVREFKKILVPSGEKKQGKDVYVALALPSTRLVSFGIHSVVDVVLKDGDLVEPGTRYYTLGVCNLKEGK